MSGFGQAARVGTGSCDYDQGMPLLNVKVRENAIIFER